MYTEWWKKTKYGEASDLFIENFSMFYPEYLSHGSEQTVWKLNNGRVLKLYTKNYKQDEYVQSKKVFGQNNDWSIHEPEIFEVGYDGPETRWIVQEEFEVLPLENGYDLDNLISHFLWLAENFIIEYDKPYSSSLFFSDYFEKDHYRSVKEVADHLKQDQDEALIREFLSTYKAGKFRDSFVYDLALEVAYKASTGRDQDLIQENLGIRKTNGLPVFFDW